MTRSAPTSGNGADAAVLLEHVTKRFGQLTVLDDVSFDIAKATAFCLLGRIVT